MDNAAEAQPSDDALHFDKDAILKKIAALQALADHPSTEDTLRLSALAKIKRLTDKYSISLDDFEKVEAYKIDEHMIRFSNPLTESRLYFVPIMSKVADFFNVRLMALALQGANEVHGFRLVGTEIDVRSAVVGVSYMMAEVRKQLQIFHDDVSARFDLLSSIYRERYDSVDYFSSGDFYKDRRMVIVQQELERIPPPVMRMVIRRPRPMTVGEALDKTSENSEPTGLRPYWASADYETMILRVAGRFFINHSEMPTIEDVNWLSVERSWGVGVNMRMTERLMEELANTDDTDDFNLNMGRGGFTPNLPVKTSRELAVISDTVRREKTERIDEHLKDESIDQKRVDLNADNAEVAMVGGSQAANRIDLSALKRKDT